MQGTEGQDGLPTAMAPTHPGAFHSLGCQRFAGGLHHTGANGEVLRLRFGIVHPVAVAAEIGSVASFFLRGWMSLRWASARMIFSTPAGSSRKIYFSNGAFDFELFSP